jgi:hypothetical protein
MLDRSSEVEKAFAQVGIGSPMSEEPPPYDYIPESANGEPDMGTVPPAKTQALKLTYFDDCGAFVEKRSILKGIIARGETSAWIAPPGAGKSALLTEISVHCAAKIDWRGHKAKEACGVVIVTAPAAGRAARPASAARRDRPLPGFPDSLASFVVSNCPIPG